MIKKPHFAISLIVILTIGYVGFRLVTLSHVATAPTAQISTLSPPAVPLKGAYLGAWVNVDGSKNEIAQLPAFNQSLGNKTVALLHTYGSLSSFPSSTLASISANGSIPIIDTGHIAYTSITNGSLDSQIVAYANGLKSYGKPVFFRYGWEMNLSGNVQSYGNAAQFVAAWQYVWQKFHDNGVTNAAFVWCPSIQSDASSYYPGNKYVDWIAVDGYDRTFNASPSNNVFINLFQGFYNTWGSSSYGKPIMIGETGGKNGGDQAAYLQNIVTTAPTMPNIKAVVYFDSQGQTGDDWRLAGAGLTQFAAMNGNSYFTPTFFTPTPPPPPPTPTPTPTPTPQPVIPTTSTSSSPTASTTPAHTASTVPVQLGASNATFYPALAMGETVVKTQYYLGTRLLATVTTSPFSYTLKTSSILNGVYAFKTVTYYSNGTTKTTVEQITIKNPENLQQLTLVAQHYAWAGIPLLVAIAIGIYLAIAGNPFTKKKTLITPIEKPPTDQPPIIQ